MILHERLCGKVGSCRDFFYLMAEEREDFTSPAINLWALRILRLPALVCGLWHFNVHSVRLRAPNLARLVMHQNPLRPEKRFYSPVVGTTLRCQRPTSSVANVLRPAVAEPSVYKACSPSTSESSTRTRFPIRSEKRESARIIQLLGLRSYVPRPSGATSYVPRIHRVPRPNECSGCRPHLSILFCIKIRCFLKKTFNRPSSIVFVKHQKSLRLWNSTQIPEKRSRAKLLNSVLIEYWEQFFIQ